MSDMLSGPDQLSPIIREMIALLPNSGTAWSLSRREAWIEAMRGILDMLYLDEPQISKSADKFDT